MPDSSNTCGRKANPQRKSCRSKNIRVRVNVALEIDQSFDGPTG